MAFFPHTIFKGSAKTKGGNVHKDGGKGNYAPNFFQTILAPQPNSLSLFSPLKNPKFWVLGAVFKKITILKKIFPFFTKLGEGFVPIFWRPVIFSLASNKKGLFACLFRVYQREGFGEKKKPPQGKLPRLDEGLKKKITFIGISLWLGLLFIKAF